MPSQAILYRSAMRCLRCLLVGGFLALIICGMLIGKIGKQESHFLRNV